MGMHFKVLRCGCVFEASALGVWAAPDVHVMLRFVMLGNICTMSHWLQHLETWRSQGSSLVPNECVITRLSVRLDSWDLGSGMPSVRDCHTSRSLLVILTNFESLFNYRMPKPPLWFQNHLLFYLFWNTKYPSATQMKCFISGEMQHFIQPEMTFSFPSRRASEPKNWLFPHLYLFPIS